MIEYDPHQWRDHLCAVRGSVIRKVLPRVLLVGAWAGLVAWADSVGWLSPMPSVGHSLVGVALGLLLVFRTNASYDRFWEGRRQWGSIVNASRNLARGASALLRGNPHLSDAVRTWTAAFAYATMSRLRNSRGLDAAESLVPAGDLASLREASNEPLAVATFLSTAIADARRAGALTDYEQMLMDAQVAALIDAAGACDRIHRTPLPFGYVVHLRTALVLYLGTLPFALLSDFGTGEAIVTLLIAFVLLGIEEIGVEIEDPFGTDANDLPLEAFCAGIERDTRSVRHIVPPVDGSNGSTTLPRALSQ